MVKQKICQKCQPETKESTLCTHLVHKRVYLGSFYKNKLKAATHSLDHQQKPKSNSNGSCQKKGVKYHFATLNSVLSSMNSIFAPMISVKMGYHFNNSIFFIKK